MSLYFLLIMSTIVKKSNRPLERTLENAKIQLIKGFPSDPFSVVIRYGGLFQRYAVEIFFKKQHLSKNRGAAIWKVRKFQPQVVVDIFRKLEGGIVPRMTPRKLDKNWKTLFTPAGGVVWV